MINNVINFTLLHIKNLDIGDLTLMQQASYLKS